MLYEAIEAVMSQSIRLVMIGWIIFAGMLVAIYLFYCRFDSSETPEMNSRTPEMNPRRRRRGI